MTHIDHPSVLGRRPRRPALRPPWHPKRPGGIAFLFERIYPHLDMTIGTGELETELDAMCTFSNEVGGVRASATPRSMTSTTIAMRRSASD